MPMKYGLSCLRRRLAKGAATCLVLFTLTVPAFGIVIGDMSTNGYITGNANYTGVTQILFDYIGQPSTYLCTGSLISDFQILTAGHCASGAENWSVLFQTPSGNTSIGVTQAIVHPGFGPEPDPNSQLYQDDVAILTLASIAPSDATRYLLDTTSAYPTSLIDLVGYGLDNSASVQSLGVRRHAVNTFDGLFPLPDQPLRMDTTFGTAPGYYGMISAGDSGSPAFFDGRIIGVGAFSNTYLGINPSFTYTSGHENLLNPTIGNWVVDEVSPEPATVGLIASGLALVLFRRRRITT
jgi:hypothetical protein